MKHLTDEQLNARLDGELPAMSAKSAEAAERHLAECPACRDRLAAFAGSDAALARSLTRDPGEAYFASFAERVQARLAAGAAAPSREPAADAAPRRRWFDSPKALAWAGAAAALVAVGAFAIQFGMQQTAGSRRGTEAPSIVGADRLESRAAAPAPAESREAAPAADAPSPAEPPRAAAEGSSKLMDQARQRTLAAAPSELATGPADQIVAPPASRDEAARKDAGARPPAGAPQRVQELRTLPGGEQVPVQTRALPQAEKRKNSFAVPPADASRPRKPMALPMTPQPTLTKSTTTQESQTRGGATPEPRLTPLAAPAPQSSALAPATGAVSGAARAETDEAATFRLCGTVANTQGRALEGATVTVVETGRSVVSGAGGAFCVDAPSAGATLSVLAIGYRSYRATVNATDAGAAHAIALRPVQTLGEREANVARLRIEPPPATQGKALTGSESLDRKFMDAERARMGRLDRSGAFVVDVAKARAASKAARFANTAPHWATAGSLWTAVADARLDADAVEARYNAAEARMHAWRIERTAGRRAAAAAAIAEFLAKSPAGARRDSVEAWRRELPPR